MPFMLVDVFAATPLSGNPLAVVLPGDGVIPDLGTIRGLAREFNQSETTIVVPPERRGVHRLRSFTPTGTEVVGVGHNAIGAWWALADQGRLDLGNGVHEFIQEIGPRDLPLEVIADNGRPRRIRMRQETPSFGPVVTDTSDLARALGIEPRRIRSDVDAVRVVSTGVPHLMVPVGVESLDVLRVTPGPLRELLAATGAQGCYVYAVASNQGMAAEARFFNPTAGIWEDPATGSAAGPLAAHLADLGLVPPRGPVVIAQGRHVGRPSRLEVELDGDRVSLSGGCIVAATGTVRLPDPPDQPSLRP